jgi:DNA-binding NarL/FixJ family response regulator
MANGMANNDKSGILIVDDQPLILAGLTQVINGQEDMICCGVARSMASARKQFRDCRPDLVTIDLGLPDGDGLELIKEFNVAGATIPILVISQYDETIYAERALKAGARGYVMKERVSEDIVDAIRSMLKGELYVSAKVAALALFQMAGRKAGRKAECLEILTNRELQVLQLLGAGLGSRAAAEKLKLSIKTLETHRENIKRKLRIEDAAGLVHYATTWVDGQGVQRANGRENAQG